MSLDIPQYELINKEEEKTFSHYDIFACKFAILLKRELTFIIIMLKKIRNRSPNKHDCELLEFAKRIRYGNGGKVHLQQSKLNLKTFENKRPIPQLVLRDMTNTAHNKNFLVKGQKVFLNDPEEISPPIKRKKRSPEFFTLIDEKRKHHHFRMFREAEYQVFKHECFQKPIIEQDMDNDVVSDNDLILQAKSDLFKNLSEVFKSVNVDPAYIKNNVSRKGRL